MSYTTKYLFDYTSWYDPADSNYNYYDDAGWEYDFDKFYDDEMNQLYLEFSIDHGIGAEANNEDRVRCLVCMNVDEDSELRNGDKGFGACYKVITGSYSDEGVTTINNDDPQWVFLGELEAVNKGSAVKSTGDNGWLEKGTWNKNSMTLDEKCDYFGTYSISGDVYYLQPYHDSQFDNDYDEIGLLSEDGFKNTGLHNGDNHLRCWFKGTGYNSQFTDTENYGVDWTPDFEADDGQSLAGWASTGVPQIVHLKDSHKRIPYVDPCSFFSY